MPVLHILYALLVVIIWGANFVASKFALEHFPPVFSSCLRFVAIAVLLLPFVKKPSTEQLKFIFILSLLGTLHFSLPQASLAAGTDIATCAILCQLGVPFSCLFGAIFLSDRLGKWRMMGMIIAFAGMIFVLGAPNVQGHLLGSFYAIASAFFFGIYNVLMKKHPEITVMQLLAWMGLMCVPQLFLLSVLFESPTLEMVIHSPMKPLYSIAFTVIFSTIVGHGLWYYLVKNHQVSNVAPFALLVPIFGVSFGQMFYQETLTWQVVIGGIVTMLGVAIIVARKPKLVERVDTI